jgi:hypothetical protein
MGEKFMSARLMLEQVFADGTIASTTRNILSTTNRRRSLENQMKKSVSGERAAEMSLSSLLYYVLIGEGRGADEFA